LLASLLLSLIGLAVYKQDHPLIGQLIPTDSWCVIQVRGNF